MLASKLLSACGGSETLYVDDVFSTYLYTGNGSTQTITNGIDLAGKGGLVITKGRSGAYGAGDHFLFDTERGRYNILQTNSTGGQFTYGSEGALAKSNGWDITGANINNSSTNYASWTFRKAAKFFDCGTYTGNGGTSGRAIAHSLGVAPGVIIIKNTTSAEDWYVFHRSLGNTGTRQYFCILNSTAAQDTGGNGVELASNWTASQFALASGTSALNVSGQTYVWYAFAHDTSAEGIIQCGSFTTDGSGNSTLQSLGWEPQFILMKRSDSATGGNWALIDNMRGFAVNSASNAFLRANTSDAEITNHGILPSATGFTYTAGTASSTQIYLAIRRPNKPPTTGTQVYNAIARTGTGAAATVTGVGFAPDLVTGFAKSSGPHKNWIDRLRGGTLVLESDSAGTEATYATAVTGWINDGAVYGADASNIINTSGINYINHFFRRAPGVFDICAYTGTGSARTVNHSLGAVPELIVVKSRNNAYFWPVYHASLGANDSLRLNATNGSSGANNYWDKTSPTTSAFSVGAVAQTNDTGVTFVAYLFASSPGIQYINSYVGDGTTGRVINCGFTAGARFVCIKATSTTGDWLIADTARGLVAGNDPRLSLNSTAAEVTTEDWLDPHSSGFIVNQVSGSNANVNGVTYLVWAIA